MFTGCLVNPGPTRQQHLKISPAAGVVGNLHAAAHGLDQQAHQREDDADAAVASSEGLRSRLAWAGA